MSFPTILSTRYNMFVFISMFSKTLLKMPVKVGCRTGMSFPTILVDEKSMNA